MLVKALSLIKEVSKWTWMLAFLLISAAFYARQLYNLLVNMFGFSVIQNIAWIFLPIFLFLIYKQSRLLSATRKILVAVFLAMVVLYISRMEIRAEQIHIIKYGVLSLLINRDLRNHGMLIPFFAGILFPTLVSSLDEFVQHFLPYRVGDIRDVGFSVVAGVFGSVLYLLLNDKKPRERA